MALAHLPLLTLLLRILLLCTLPQSSYADEANLWRNQAYANGFNGGFPLQRYRSANVQDPILNYCSTVEPAMKAGTRFSRCGGTWCGIRAR